MNLIDFRNIFIAKLSGIAEYKNENEIWCKERGVDVTIEFLNNSIFFVKVRRYYNNGNKFWEQNYKVGERHGKYICWFEDGNKNLEENYQNGKLIKTY